MQRSRKICSIKEDKCFGKQPNLEVGWMKPLDYSDNESQRFYFCDSLTYPGFYIIKDEFGKCISVPENLDPTELKFEPLIAFSEAGNFGNGCIRIIKVKIYYFNVLYLELRIKIFYYLYFFVF